MRMPLGSQIERAGRIPEESVYTRAEQLPTNESSSGNTEPCTSKTVFAGSRLIDVFETSVPTDSETPVDTSREEVRSGSNPIDLV